MAGALVTQSLGYWLTNPECTLEFSVGSRERTAYTALKISLNGCLT